MTTSLGDALEAFILEHEYCGELDGGVPAVLPPEVPMRRIGRRRSFQLTLCRDSDLDQSSRGIGHV
jgi:hypothetical protein